jgi:hypothetical protein
MPYCPYCNAEYEANVEECPTCGAELLAERPGNWFPGNNPGLRPVELCVLHDMAQADLFEAQLRAAGIVSIRRPRTVALYVPAAYLEHARQALEGEAAGPAGTTGTLSLSELHRIRLVCSECEHELSVDVLHERVPSSCPSCGHLFDIGAALPVLDRYADVMRMMANADFEIEVEPPAEE